MDSHLRLIPAISPRLAMALALAALCWSAPGRAAEVTVDCDSGGSLQAAINALIPAGPNTINVTGTCTENVFVSGQNGLTIQGPEGGTASIVSAAATDPDGNEQAVFFIEGSSGITLRRLDIRGAGQVVVGVWSQDATVQISGCTIRDNMDTGVFVGGGAGSVSLGGRPSEAAVSVKDNFVGVWAAGSNLGPNGNVTIENNSADALIHQAGNLTVNGRRGPILIRNNGFGVAIIGAVGAGFSGMNTIQNNGPYGVFIARSGTVSFGGGLTLNNVPGFTTIEGHTQTGVIIFGGFVLFSTPGDARHKIRNNGGGANPLKAGIYVGRPSTLVIRQTEVTNNVGGPGVLLDSGSYVNFLNDEVSGNSGDGVSLRHLSIAQFGQLNTDGTTIPANTLITGNGGAAVACDATSVAFGDLEGISPLQCTGADRRPVGAGGRSAAEDAEARIQQILERRSTPPRRQ